MALDQVDVDNMDQKNDMSVFDHIDELRGRLIKALASIVIVGIICYIFNDEIFKYVIFGPTQEWFPTYSLLNQLFGSDIAAVPAFEKQAIGFAEAFITAIKVSFVMGLIISFPLVFRQLWLFIRPGLYKKEQKATRGIVFICSVLFLIGVSFGYFIISPFATKFLMGYTIEGVKNIPTLGSYLSYMVMFTLPAGLIFELPVLVFFLAKIGLITAETMKKYRRHAIIAILMLAALMTPPDVFTQFMIGIPLAFLYEIGIIVAKRVEKQNEVD